MLWVIIAAIRRSLCAAQGTNRRPSCTARDLRWQKPVSLLLLTQCFQHQANQGHLHAALQVCSAAALLHFSAPIPPYFPHLSSSRTRCSPDGRFLAAAEPADYVTLYDAATG